VLSSKDAPRLDGALAALRTRNRAEAGETAVASRLVYAGVAAFAVLFVFAVVVHYTVFGMARLDLGDMVQAIWSTLHGRFLESTTEGGLQSDRLGSHVDPFLLLFAPLFWIWSSPLPMLVVQVLAVASGALPVFWLARKHLDSSRAAAHFAFAYLLYPATQFNAFTLNAGFHSVSFALPLVLYAIWFLDEDRLVAFSAVALLACTTKEEIPIAVGCLGLWYAVRTGRRLFGFSVFAVGLGVTLFDFLWVIPHFAPGGVNPLAERYAAVGGTPRGMVHKLFTDPAAFVHAIATGHKAAYLVLLLVPFLGLWLLEPLLFLGAVPDLVINLLSSEGGQTSIVFQYTAGILPFVLAATIFGATRFRRRADRLSLWVLVGAAVLALYSPIRLLGADVPALGSPRVAAKAHALSLVPRGAPVSASNQLGAYLSTRRYIYEFPVIRTAGWIVLDINDPNEGGAYKRVVRRYEADKAWRVVYSSHGIAVLHKRGATEIGSHDAHAASRRYLVPRWKVDNAGDVVQGQNDAGSRKELFGWTSPARRR
jgi:uncharacterized membrane protein